MPLHCFIPVQKFRIFTLISLQEPMKKRKMAMVANQVKIEEADLRDIQLWLDRPASERIA